MMFGGKLGSPPILRCGRKILIFGAASNAPQWKICSGALCG
jgi:hypothetical protein